MQLTTSLKSFLLIILLLTGVQFLHAQTAQVELGPDEIGENQGWTITYGQADRVLKAIAVTADLACRSRRDSGDGGPADRLRGSADAIPRSWCATPCSPGFVDPLDGATSRRARHRQHFDGEGVRPAALAKGDVPPRGEGAFTRPRSATTRIKMRRPLRRPCVSGCSAAARAKPHAPPRRQSATRRKFVIRMIVSAAADLNSRFTPTSLGHGSDTVRLRRSGGATSPANRSSTHGVLENPPFVAVGDLRLRRHIPRQAGRRRRPRYQPVARFDQPQVVGHCVLVVMHRSKTRRAPRNPSSPCSCRCF